MIMNEEETDARYVCDVCGVEIQYQTEGVYCPVCGLIFCLDCSADHPIMKVRVREDDPDYKKDESITS